MDLVCAICQRKMQGTFNNGKPHYRCRYNAEYAKNAALDHPLTVYVREEAILPELDKWIAKTFAPGQLTATLQAMQQAQSAESPTTTAAAAARRTMAECDRRIVQYRAALVAGTDPKLATEWINQAQSEKASLGKISSPRQQSSPRSSQRTRSSTWSPDSGR
ncbi:hypothetical protein SANTM175S_05991 [Streptomyces antimycoticus]